MGAFPSVIAASFQLTSRCDRPGPRFKGTRAGCGGEGRRVIKHFKSLQPPPCAVSITLLLSHGRRRTGIAAIIEDIVASFPEANP